MNNGNRRRTKKRAARRYKVRYDRIVAALLCLAVIIILPTTCIKSCTSSGKKSKNDQNSGTSGTAQSSIEDNLQSSGSQHSNTAASGTVKPSAAEYTTETHGYDDVFRGDLVLVNTTHEYRFPADDSELTVVYDYIAAKFGSMSYPYNVSDMVIKLNSRTMDSLDRMLSDFYASTGNSDIYIIGGYRTQAEQTELYTYGNSIFPGGFSDYHTGSSFDLAIFPKDGSSSGHYSAMGVYSWIDENAANYGFILRFPMNKEQYTIEPSRTQTYRYVGVPHSVYIKENDLCLEEYIRLIKEHNNTDPIEITVGENIYNVYYVPANKDADTDIPVSSNKVYSVSGNNEDGFIVTVAMN